LGRTSARPGPLCNAPFVSLNFDPFGNVQACCANALYPLGNVGDSTLEEIWGGDRASSLRDALTAQDLSFGCTVCRFRMDFQAGEVPRDYYDMFSVEDRLAYPQLLSFSLHNTCNLECIMCGADASSRIRTRRDGLEPLPHVYGDSFFEQLRPFLENASAIDLVGGEPFLVREHRRVWDLLTEIGVRPKVAVTTNGTVWNAYVEQVLDRFDTTICVSLDGLSKSVFEAVRVGASFEEVMENLERFRAYATNRGTGLHLSFSLVRQNWFELGAVLSFADQRGIEVSVQTVIEPDFGVQNLPTEHLRLVVESLEQEAVDLAPKLTLNRGTYLCQVARLRAELDERQQGIGRPALFVPPAPGNAERVASMLLGAARARGPLAAATRRRDRRDALAGLRRWSGQALIGRLELSTDGTVLCEQLGDSLPLAVGRAEEVEGLRLSALLKRIAEAVGGELWIAEEVVDRSCTTVTLWIGGPVRDKRGAVLRLVAWPEGGRCMVAVSLDMRMMPRDQPTGSPPVAVALRSGDAR
jgi:MoaA/NifB/PqqE/SkfB family radical SAM enzyme